jgi:hypothetical protein
MLAEDNSSYCLKMGHKKVLDMLVWGFNHKYFAARGRFGHSEKKLMRMERSLLILSVMRDLISICSPSVAATEAGDRK